jgi:hypothetical protein
MTPMMRIIDLGYLGAFLMISVPMFFILSAIEKKELPILQKALGNTQLKNPRSSV